MDLETAKIGKKKFPCKVRCKTGCRDKAHVSRQNPYNVAKWREGDRLFGLGALTVGHTPGFCQDVSRGKDVQGWNPTWSRLSLRFGRAHSGRGHSTRLPSWDWSTCWHARPVAAPTPPAQLPSSFPQANRTRALSLADRPANLQPHWWRDNSGSRTFGGLPVPAWPACCIQDFSAGSLVPGKLSCRQLVRSRRS